MKLIIINGPCGVGKSTLAKKLHNEMPLSFLLELDLQTRLISHYREYKEECWEMVRELGKTISETCLRLGRDVIFEKMIYAPEVIDDIRAIGEKLGAEVYEIILWAPKEVVTKRAAGRCFIEGGLMTAEKVEKFWHAIDELKQDRPDALVIDTHENDEDKVFEIVKKHIS